MKYLKMAVLAVTLLALAAGSAQAQECVVKAGAPNVRAEGITEMVGAITLRCRGARAGEGLGFGNTAPTKLEIAVELNTDITNERDTADMIMNKPDTTDTFDTSTTEAPWGDFRDTKVGYSDEEVVLTARALGVDQAYSTTAQNDLDGNFTEGAVSDDLRTVTWKVMDGDDADDTLDTELGLFQLTPLAVDGTAAAANSGFELKIVGLRADASGVGHNGEITATVSVNGAAVGTAMKVASVMNGLEVSVKAPDPAGTECADFSGMVEVTLKEGYKKGAFMAMDQFQITFTGVPEGVTVTVPANVPLPKDNEGTTANEMEGAFVLKLYTGTGDGVGKPADGKAMVELSATGSATIRYMIGTEEYQRTATDAEVAADDDLSAGDEVTDTRSSIGTETKDKEQQEWAKLPISLKWKGGEVVMNADSMLGVSFYPEGGSMTPRFVGDSDPDTLVTIKDCVTSLTFPFVSSASGYDTGIVVSNTKDASGSCTATYSGSEEVMTSQVIEGNSHWIFLVSSHMQDYTGRLMVECDFGGIDGYAQINDHMGNANGYLPRM